MNRIVQFWFAFVCIAMQIACSAHEICYDNCQSIEDFIAKETEAIAHIHPTDHDARGQLYVARGESYLLNEQYKQALDDFQNAEFHLEHFLDVENRIAIAFRITFGSIVSYDNLGMQEQAERAVRQLRTIVAHFECSDCERNHACQEMIILSGNNVKFDDTRSAVMMIAAVDPNQPQPSWWCEKTVKNTTAGLRGIAANIPSSVIRFSALELIKLMEEKAMSCCYAGGLWSACIKSLADKFELWNRKWKLLGIPPDPAWDSDLK